MAAKRLAVLMSPVLISGGLMSVGLAMAGCAINPLPKPLYALQPTPPPFRTASDGTRIDNADVSLDAEGFRIDRNGQRTGEVDVVAKTANQTSNPVAGYYISSLGANADGNVMAPSVGAGIGVGSGVGSADPVPSGESMTPLPGQTPMPGQAPAIPEQH